MNGNRTRIIDIAQELGVSTATVSNVIHGKTKKISDETVKRVQELLEKKQYIPSMAGILLAQNDSRIIGIVVNDHEKYEKHVLEDSFIAASLNALSIELEKAGYFMMVKVTSDRKDIIRFASMWNMEGLVLIGFCSQDYMKLRESMHIPFVIYDGYFDECRNDLTEQSHRAAMDLTEQSHRAATDLTEQSHRAAMDLTERSHRMIADGPERVCNLVIDDYGGGLLVGKHLSSMGHENVLCIADNDICMDRERIEGCRAGLQSGTADFLQIPMEQEARSRFYTERMAEILQYSAVFAVSDFYAIELIYFLQEHGIRVPEDISVVGFDDIPLCTRIHPSLTTVRQSASERAECAVETLKSLKTGNCKEKQKKLSVYLVERCSVKRMTLPEQ